MFRPLFIALTLLAAPAVPAHAQAADDLIVVNIADSQLQKSLTLDNAMVRKRGPISQAMIVLTNASSRPVDLEYRAEWSDSERFPVDTETRWEAITIDGSASRTINISGRHPKAEAVTFTIKRR